MNEHGVVRLEVRDGIGTITFSHPKANALSSALLVKLAEAFGQLASETSTRVIVLRSEGTGSFCAGANLEELRSVNSLDDAIEFFNGVGRVILAMRNCPKFVIGRVHGKAVGGGVGLIAGADYVVAESGAAVRLSEFEVGIGPFVVGPAIERKIGTAQFCAMAVDSGWRDAVWAGTFGLYQRVESGIAALDATVGEVASLLVNRSQEAAEKLKRVLWSGTEDWPTLLQTRARMSAELWMKARP